MNNVNDTFEQVKDVMGENLVMYDPCGPIPEFPVGDDGSCIMDVLNSNYNDEKVYKNHILMCGPQTPMNTLDIRRKFTEILNSAAPIEQFEDLENIFSDQAVRLRWYLMPIKAFPGSFNKDYGSQLGLIGIEGASITGLLSQEAVKKLKPTIYYPTTAAVEAMKWLLYRMHTGKDCEDKNTWLRTSSMDSGGDATLVGRNHEGKISIGHWWVCDEHATIGLGVMRNIYPRANANTKRVSFWSRLLR